LINPLLVVLGELHFLEKEVLIKIAHLVIVYFSKKNRASNLATLPFQLFSLLPFPTGIPGSKTALRECKYQRYTCSQGAPWGRSGKSQNRGGRRVGTRFPGASRRKAAYMSLICDLKLPFDTTNFYI